MIVSSAPDALSTLIKASGKPITTISRNLGHNKGYINTFISKKTDIQTSTMARIARECGFTLALVPSGSPALEDESVVSILPE